MRVKFTHMAAIAILLSCIALPAPAQSAGQQTPCGIAIGDHQGSTRPGLVPVAGGLVYDSVQGLCWLADANLAGSAQARARIMPFLSASNPDPDVNQLDKNGQNTDPPDTDPPVIHADGTMDYETALNWVNALNTLDNGHSQPKGWLGHSNWQLPTTQPTDFVFPAGSAGPNNSCSSNNNGNFGALCKGSAMGYLYNVALAIQYPGSVTPTVTNVIWPMVSLQPGLYWTREIGPAGTGRSTFSFNNLDHGSNTTNYNFFHALPMTHDVLGTTASGARDCSVLPYVTGPGAGKAVLDSCTGLSWTVNANLAAENSFGFTDTATLPSIVNTTSFPMIIPMIQPDGAMHNDALCGDPTFDEHGNLTNSCPPPARGWIVFMNNQAYAGSSNWQMPGVTDLQNLYYDLGLLAGGGDPRLEARTFVGPFWHLQPGFYWSCERTDLTGSQAPCADSSVHPGFDPGPNHTWMEYSFNFDNGFQGTDKIDKAFYVMVYFPAPAIQQ